MKVKLTDVRLTFPNVWEPKSIKGSAPKFSAAAIIMKGSTAMTTLGNAINAVGQEKWADKWPEVKKSLVAKDMVCLHDGDTKSEYEGYASNLFVNASSDVRPDVRDSDGKTALLPQDGKPYSGCYVDFIIDVWAQSNEFGKRVNAKLLGVQFRRDGPRLAGGATAADSDFEAIPQAAGEAAGAATSAGGAADLFAATLCGGFPAR